MTLCPAAAPLARLVMGVLLGSGLAIAATACELVLVEQRSDRVLLRASMATPSVSVAFTHSVLGTPVTDRYEWQTDAWHLVAERFEGEGYGLPHTALTGERLTRWGSGWQLSTHRRADPLVLRVAPGTAMRIELDDGRMWPLDAWTAHAVRLNAVNCNSPTS